MHYLFAKILFITRHYIQDITVTYNIAKKICLGRGFDKLRAILYLKCKKVLRPIYSLFCVYYEK